MISEIVCDVANAVLRCEHWKPEDFNFDNKKFIPDPKIDDNDNQPLIEALPLDVLVDSDKRGKAFC